MLRLVVIASLLGLAQSGSPFATFLASMKGKSTFDWQGACKSLGQTPAGYSSGMGGGVTSYHLKCNTNKVLVKCKGNPYTSCESTYVAPATISDTPPSGKYNKPASAGKCGGLTQKEVQEFLNIHNKMRCAVGAPPVEWDAELQCQAQKAQNDIQAFKHSDCYNLPIKAGENIATGTNVATAAWMWFTEYLQSTDYAHGGETGHFSAMSWKGVTKIGCGIGRGGKGVIRCQYVGSPLPNMGGEYDSNLNKFEGESADFAKCNLPMGDLKSHAKMFQKWGILNPSGQMASNLGLYSITDSLWPHASSMAFFSACAFLGTAAMVSLGVAMRRWNAKARDVNTQEHLELSSVEDPDSLE